MRKLVVLLIVAVMIMLGAVESYANVSSAAVLFLRIAAGARAAGMGEAFVAVADDATATHWNPAGLGNYPLSSKWFDIGVPEEFQPLRHIAIFRNDAGESDYRHYDIWGISPKGLVKYSRGQWIQGDIIEPSSEQTAEGILRQYVGLVGDSAEDKVQPLMVKLGRANNPYPLERLDSLKNNVMQRLPEDLKSKTELENAFNSAIEAYNQCLLDWTVLKKAFDAYHDAVKDSVISEGEADKIQFAVEKAKTRALPPQLTIPFDVNFAGEINDIAADNDYLWIASGSNLYRYNGSNWQKFGADQGLAVGKVEMIRLYNKKAYLGTDNGMVVYDNGAFIFFGSNTGLPEKEVSGIAVAKDNEAWTVIDGDLYHYDGNSWKNYFTYNDVLQQSDSAIYETMKLYGTPAERTEYMAKFDQMNPKAAPVTVPDGGISMTRLIDSVGVMRAYLASQDTANNKIYIDPRNSGPGRAIKVPFTAGLRLATTDMAVDNRGDVWIGTDYGLLRFDGHRWVRYGYRNYSVDADQTVMQLALQRVNGDSARAERLARNIRTVNELTDDSLKAGQVIKMYANPAGSRINEITPYEGRLFFATSSGTIVYDGRWSRYNQENLGTTSTATIDHRANNAWFASSDRILVRGGAHGELTMMHVNWLPELASDLYYEFFSYVKNVEALGTIGGNVTFLSYGNIKRTDPYGNDLGDFSAFDVAATLSYGTALSPSLSGGISAKIIYSHLSSVGAGKEKGSGTSTGIALDAGILYKLTHRVTFGAAVTNLGPDIAYIDVAQADPLPRNLAIGLGWKLLESAYNKFLITVEANKSLVGLNGSLSQEMKEVVLNGGAEYWYGSFIAFRAGYIYDQEGEIKTPTLGFGLQYRLFRFDFAYIPSNDQVPLANTMRFSLSIAM
ncbi:conserved exported hypothetical protein [Candidatus Zixiibacteriota bacterium]|nr:conserved exported hypothetical protein [candidate division Zixibacteria bacterium]